MTSVSIPQSALASDALAASSNARAGARPYAETQTFDRPGESASAFELRFDSLFHEGRALVFPCDAAGQVDLDALSDRARQYYLYARRAVGREYGFPKVHRRQASR